MDLRELEQNNHELRRLGTLEFAAGSFGRLEVTGWVPLNKQTLWGREPGGSEVGSLDVWISEVGRLDVGMSGCLEVWLVTPARSTSDGSADYYYCY